MKDNIQEKINSEDISVVVQGAVSNKEEAIKCLNSIRKYLPQAEIILSTWEGSDVKGLKFDKLILNKDPGGTVFNDIENKLNNLNRIIVSSKAGIQAATKKYILKVRSDLILKNDNVLILKDDLAKRDPHASLFKQRIFAYDMFSIKYNTKKELKQKMIFHISDWCCFGLREDIEQLFDIQLTEEPDFSRYFVNNKKTTTNEIHKYRLWKMSPEQYITSENAKKIFKDLVFENYLDINPVNTEISENFIINNFRVFSKKEWGIQTLKKIYRHINMRYEDPSSYYSKYETFLDYNKYCGGDLEVNSKTYNKYCLKLRKHFFKLILGESIKEKPSELISTFYYFFKMLFYFIGEIVKNEH